MFGKKDVIHLDEETRQKVLETIRKQQQDNVVMIESALNALSKETKEKVKDYVKEEVERQLKKRDQ